MVDMTIEQEINDAENYAKSDMKLRIKNIVFCVLASFIEKMLDFDIEIVHIEAVVLEFSRFYDLSGSDLHILITNAEKSQGKEVGNSENLPREVVRGVPDWLKDLERAPNSVEKRSSNLSDMLRRA